MPKVRRNTNLHFEVKIFRSHHASERVYRALAEAVCHSTPRIHYFDQYTTFLSFCADTDPSTGTASASTMMSASASALRVKATMAPRRRKTSAVYGPRCTPRNAARKRFR